MPFILKTEHHLPCQNISEEHTAGSVTVVIIINLLLVYEVCKGSEKLQEFFGVNCRKITIFSKCLFGIFN